MEVGPVRSFADWLLGTWLSEVRRRPVYAWTGPREPAISSRSVNQNKNSAINMNKNESSKPKSPPTPLRTSVSDHKCETGWAYLIRYANGRHSACVGRLAASSGAKNTRTLAATLESIVPSKFSSTKSIPNSYGRTSRSVGWAAGLRSRLRTCGLITYVVLTTMSSVLSSKDSDSTAF